MRSKNSRFALFMSPVLMFITAAVVHITFLDTSPSAGLGSTPLVTAFQFPRPIINATLCSISVTATIFLELVLDIFFHPPFYFPSDLWERLFMIFAAIVPGVCVLNALEISPNVHAPTIFVFCHSCQSIGFIGPIFFLCWKLVPSHFPLEKCFLSYVCWALGASIIAFDLQKVPVLIWPKIVTAFFMLCSQGIFFHMLFNWGMTLSERNSQQITRNKFFIIFATMTADDFSCFLYILFAEILIVIIPIFMAMSCKFSWLNCNLISICSCTYIHALFSVLTSCIPGRVKQYSASKSLQQKIDSNHATVRYISHEIRSPLNIVLNGVRMLKEKVKGICDDEVTQDIDDIEYASCAATSIVDDLLNFEKIESGTFQIELNKVPAFSCLHKMTTRCRPLAQHKNIQLSVKDNIKNKEVQATLVIDVDLIKFEQVIRNLIVNSIKFTPPGGLITVTLKLLSEIAAAPADDSHRLAATSENFIKPKVSCFAKTCWENWKSCMCTRFPFIARVHCEPPLCFDNDVEHACENNSHQSPFVSDYLIVEITDSGVGMTKKQCENLFRQFVQFDANTLQGGGGSGLGLWICKEILNQHKGEITVFSKGQGQGSTFSIKLRCFFQPCTKFSEVCEKTEIETKKEMEKIPFSEENNIASRFDLQNMRTTAALQFLIVDDISLNRKIIIKMLKRIGETYASQCQRLEFEFFEADDGLSALQVVKTKSNALSAIFIDNTMQSMNGPEAVLQMRETHHYKGTVIGVTGNAVSADVSSFLSSGVDTVLIKPVSYEKLENIFSGIISNHFVVDF